MSSKDPGVATDFLCIGESKDCPGDVGGSGVLSVCMRGSCTCALTREFDSGLSNNDAVNESVVVLG